MSPSCFLCHLPPLVHICPSQGLFHMTSSTAWCSGDSELITPRQWLPRLEIVSLAKKKKQNFKPEGCVSLDGGS